MQISQQPKDGTMNEIKGFFAGPYRTDGVYVFTQSGNMALMIADLYHVDGLLGRVCDILNGKCVPNKPVNAVYSDSCIYLNGEAFLEVRGWGALTSPYRFNLPPEVAARLQDEFGEWVASKLSGAQSSEQQS